MPETHSTRILTRVADLDTQRHVNNGSYALFARESQYDLLSCFGYDLQTLIAAEIQLQVLDTATVFLRQQSAGQEIRVQTEVIFFESGLAQWRHVIFNVSKNEEAAIVEMQTRFFRQGQSCLPEGIPVEKDVSLFEPNHFHQFSAGFPDCRQTVSDIALRSIDLSVFKSYPLQLFWRLTEESRWDFLNEMGLTLDTLLARDTMLFLIKSNYHFYRFEREPGLKIHTWFEKMEKARSYIRQRALTADGQLYMDTVGEFIVVSLSKAKPVRAPEYLLELAKPYTGG